MCGRVLKNGTPRHTFISDRIAHAVWSAFLADLLVEHVFLAAPLTDKAAVLGD